MRRLMKAVALALAVSVWTPATTEGQERCLHGVLAVDYGCYVDYYDVFICESGNYAYYGGSSGGDCPRYV